MISIDSLNGEKQQQQQQQQHHQTEQKQTNKQQTARLVYGQHESWPNLLSISILAIGSQINTLNT